MFLTTNTWIFTLKDFPWQKWKCSYLFKNQFFPDKLWNSLTWHKIWYWQSSGITIYVAILRGGFKLVISSMWWNDATPKIRFYLFKSLARARHWPALVTGPRSSLARARHWQSLSSSTHQFLGWETDYCKFAYNLHTTGELHSAVIKLIIQQLSSLSYSLTGN